MTVAATGTRSIVRPLAAFLILGFALSWYPWLLHALGRPGNGGPNPIGLLLAALCAGALFGDDAGNAAPGLEPR